ncbi:hypothetical protein [Helicobacter cappadocius]|uniref:Septum formation initiator n=1 Tax=Helicobacter cappadocius TaxID=3063998 RepID=A0AA90PKN4_9HELI|nr:MULTISPECIES: hypothetical protein [unclassified Helicobacter]MDO7253441.1 hypothetical protein [Helicobacter sp. faydin-H75]MDP2539295.1 hypothetical protein [Helicobacter sp. faydin-H76]
MRESISIDKNEKEELFFDDEKKGLNINALFWAYVILAFSLVIVLPKIYLASNIYYISRDISKLQTQENLLKEENNRLERELEDVRFKYLMMNLN